MRKGRGSGYPCPVAKRPAKSAARSRGPREVEIRPDVPPGGSPVARRVRFAEIIGQERAIANLRSCIQSGRVHHAWIFHGPPGVGKFTTALAFAGVILDPTTAPGLSGEVEPDPESETQRLLESGSHPDLHIVNKELAVVSREASVRDSKQRNIAKDVLEEFLIEPAVKTSASRGGLAAKVFIVDEAELIDGRGQNALLKTLEEPAPGSVIILVTSSEERLLPTIRSRCQRVGFVPLSEADMERWLKQSELDVASLGADDRRWLMQFAAGSPGTAELALETGLVQWRSTLAPMLAELEQGRFPIEMGQIMAKLADDWAAAWVDRPGNENASKDAANKAAARQMFRLIAEHYRHRLRRQADAGSPDEMSLRAIDLVCEAERQAESNVQAQFVMENLAAQLSALPR
jgi:DNA polymerase III subunit delta'